MGSMSSPIPRLWRVVWIYLLPRCQHCSRVYINLAMSPMYPKSITIDSMVNAARWGLTVRKYADHCTIRGSAIACTPCPCRHLDRWRASLVDCRATIFSNRAQGITRQRLGTPVLTGSTSQLIVQLSERRTPPSTTSMLLDRSHARWCRANQGRMLAVRRLGYCEFQAGSTMQSYWWNSVRLLDIENGIGS